MRIGIIAHLKHPIKPPFAGGLEVFTYSFTHQMLKRGHHVVLFASSMSDQSLPLISIMDDQNYDSKTGIRRKFRDLPSEYIAEHRAYFELMNKIDQYGLDIIFNHSLHYVPIAMANICKTPMLTTLHTPPFYELKLAITAERLHPVINYVTISKSNARSWSEIVPDCRVIYNGIDINTWTNVQIGIEYQACWFGRIHPDKGLHFAIQAAKLARIPLKIAGPVADKRYFDQIITPLLDDSIELLGLLDQDKLKVLISSSSVCLVTPDWEEPFGLVIVEAMSCGTPIVGFKNGALTELVISNTGILVDYPDVEKLAKAIPLASGLPRNQVSDYARLNFSIESMTDNYIQLMEELISEQSTKSNDE